METQKFSVEWRDTDFLCVGGGIAGLMAAINAAEQGMDCVVLEKADTRRSGAGMGEVFLHENLGHRAPVGRVGHSHEA